MNAIHKIELAIAGLCRFVACSMVVGITALIVVEFTLRGLFGRSTYIMGEYVGYMLAICIVFSMTEALNKGTHIQIRFLFDMFGLNARKFLRLIFAAATLCVMVLIAWYFYNYTSRLWMRGTTSVTIVETPLWIPGALLTFGLGLLCLQLSLLLVRTAIASPSALDGAEASQATEHI